MNGTTHHAVAPGLVRNRFAQRKGRAAPAGPPVRVSSPTLGACDRTGVEAAAQDARWRDGGPRRLGHDDPSVAQTGRKLQQ